MNGSQIIS